MFVQDYNLPLIILIQKRFDLLRVKLIISNRASIGQLVSYRAGSTVFMHVLNRAFD